MTTSAADYNLRSTYETAYFDLFGRRAILISTYTRYVRKEKSL